MKKSLAITDEQRYGKSSPMAVMAEGGKDKKPTKTAPTISLYGPQVDAFCACDLKPGESGTATIHYVVKSVKMGSEYGNEVLDKNAKKEVTLSISHVESEKKDDDEGDDEEEKEETPEEEATEEGSEDDDTPDKESDEQAPDPTAAQPKNKGKKPVGVSDTGLDDI